MSIVDLGGGWIEFGDDDLFAAVADEIEASTLPDIDAERFLADPGAWVRERLGEFLWSKQVEITQSVRDNRFTAVQSCHGVGKSFIASRLAVWWIAVHPPGSARIVTTAPTMDQVVAILWTEINGAAAKAEARGNPLPGSVNATQWKISGQVVGIGRKPSDYNKEAFQGIHSRFVLVILDEACGVLEHFWTSAMSIATGVHCRILAIGNPDDPSSHFAQVCASPRWHLIVIDAFCSPNFTDEKVPRALAEVLVSQAYVEEMREEFGEESPIYQSKVEAKFPQDAEDGVVRLSKLLACYREPDTPHTPEVLLPVELGVDVAAGGGDEAVIRERRGILAGRVWRIRTRDSEKLVDLIVHAIQETGATSVKVDTIGVGWGIVGSLCRRKKQGKHDALIIGVNVSQASTEPLKYLRLRSQIWWQVGRRLTEDRAWDLSALDTKDRDRLTTQLTAPRYWIDASGRIVVEPKDDTKTRIGKSPDDADALLLAYFAGMGQGAAFVSAMKKAAQEQGIEVPSATRNWRNQKAQPQSEQTATPEGGRRGRRLPPSGLPERRRLGR